MLTGVKFEQQCKLYVQSNLVISNSITMKLLHVHVVGLSRDVYGKNTYMQLYDNRCRL